MKRCNNKGELENAVKDGFQLFMLTHASKPTYKRKWFGLRKELYSHVMYYELLPCTLKRACDNGYAYIILHPQFAIDTMYHVSITDLYYNKI